MNEVPAITGLLLNAGAKSVLILAVGIAAILCLRRTSAAIRHMVGIVTIVALLLLPALSLVLPRWEVLPRRNHEPSNPPLESASIKVVAPESGQRTPITPSVEQTTSQSAAASLANSKPFDTASSLLLIWLVGILVSSGPSVIGLISLCNLRRRADPVTDRNWLELLDQISARLRLKRPVLLLKSASRRMPMTWGLFRARVLLPAEANKWAVEWRRAVLLHEIAHVKRWDYLTNLLTQIACSLYWFNPLVWLLARSMVAEREQACDDLVLQQGTKADGYAQQIIELAGRVKRRTLASFSAVAMARPTRLETRIRAIVDADRNRNALSPAHLLAILVVPGVLLVPLAMIGAAQNPAAAPIGHLLKGVRLVVDANGLNFDGQLAAPNELQDLLEKVPNRQNTVLELAVGDDTLPVKAYFDAQRVAAELVQRLGFAYLSNVGVQPPPKKPPVGQPKVAEQSRWKFELISLILPSAAEKRFVSLDDLQMYSEMPSNAPTAWVDGDPRKGWQLIVQNAHNYPTERGDGIKLWQTKSAEDIAQPAGLAGVPFERTGHYQLRKEDMPITILIPQWGMLRIDGFDERTLTAILQYKRVVDAKLETAPRRSLPRQGAAGVGAEVGAYTTRRGDTLARIAHENGVTIEALRAANPDVDWNRLKVGQMLIIPAPHPESRL
jgi:beta-lactamase regulating signal transducer with metallopeptidase domain